MNRKPTVSVGIPTYNGAANIVHTISDLLRQDLSKISLQDIIVHADGCTDGTQKIVRELAKKHSVIKLVDTDPRVGKSQGINNLFGIFKSDIAVIVDDDIRVSDSRFLEKLCEPIIKHQADLVSCPMLPTQESGMISRSLRAGMKLKENAIQSWRGGDNIYACRGPIRAHSRSLYSKIKLSSQSIGDDMYTYLYAKSQGFRFQYIPNTQIYFQVPESISDHQKQSVRFMQSVKNIEDTFGKDFSQMQFSVPLDFKVKQIVKTILSEHVWLLIYLSLYLRNWIIHEFLTPSVNHDKWDRIAIKKVSI